MRSRIRGGIAAHLCRTWIARLCLFLLPCLPWPVTATGAEETGLLRQNPRSLVVTCGSTWTRWEDRRPNLLGEPLSQALPYVSVRNLFGPRLLINLSAQRPATKWGNLGNLDGPWNARVDVTLRVSPNIALRLGARSPGKDEGLSLDELIIASELSDRIKRYSGHSVTRGADFGGFVSAAWPFRFGYIGLSASHVFTGEYRILRAAPKLSPGNETTIAPLVMASGRGRKVLVSFAWTRFEDDRLPDGSRLDLQNNWDLSLTLYEGEIEPLVLQLRAVHQDDALHVDSTASPAQIDIPTEIALSGSRRFSLGGSLIAGLTLRGLWMPESASDSWRMDAGVRPEVQINERLTFGIGAGLARAQSAGVRSDGFIGDFFLTYTGYDR